MLIYNILENVTTIYECAVRVYVCDVRVRHILNCIGMECRNREKWTNICCLCQGQTIFRLRVRVIFDRINFAIECSVD